MLWTAEHNEVLIREMYLFEPWQFKRGSKQRGQVWEQISDSLNDIDSPKFTVSQKAVRDHYNLVEKEHKKRIRDEEKGSGISPEHTDFDNSMEDVIERFKCRDNVDIQQDADKKEKADSETAQAVEMRKSSMETFAQSKKRKATTSEDVKKGKKPVGSDTLAYLRVKAEIDAELKREELMIRKAELENETAQQNAFKTQQQFLTERLFDNVNRQQEQQQQLMQQMQIQNTAMLNLLQKFSKNN